MQRGGFNTGPYEHHLQNGFDPYHAFVGLMPRFVDLARSAAEERAVSYRDFHVGAVLYAGNEACSRVATLDGANQKISPSHPKRCAEMDVIDQAEALGFSRVVGMVIAGTSDPEKIKGVMGVATPTLHPCDVCRDRMVDCGLFDDGSLIVTISTEEDRYEVHTYDEMMQRWQSPETARTETSTATFDVTQWPWRQLAYGRNLDETPDSQPWRVAKFALGLPVVPIPETS
jgi:cytidine deaminase